MLVWEHNFSEDSRRFICKRIIQVAIFHISIISLINVVSSIVRILSDLSRPSSKYVAKFYPGSAREDFFGKVLAQTFASFWLNGQYRYFHIFYSSLLLIYGRRHLGGRIIIHIPCFVLELCTTDDISVCCVCEPYDSLYSFPGS